VDEFVGDQLPAFDGSWFIRASPEENIGTDGKRLGTELPAEVVRYGARVDPHRAEIVAESRAHLLSQGTLQRLPGAALP